MRLVIAIALGFVTCPVLSQTPVQSYRVVRKLPHDSRAFTQGLAFDGDWLLESTGGTGRSTVRRVDLSTGEPTRLHRLGRRDFGEGLAVVGDRVIQLTWKSHRAYVYDKTTLALKRTIPVPWRAWGLCYDGEHLIMSDGTATLRFLDPTTLRTVREVRVRDGRRRVWRLNELEVVDGEVFANVWKSSRIARIDPMTGRVNAWIELKGLNGKWRPRNRGEDVLNGIAYDGDRLVVTGKHWPWLFEIEIVEKPGRPRIGKAPNPVRAPTVTRPLKRD